MKPDRARSALEKLMAMDRERMLLSRAAALLQWDQETYMPPAAVEERAEQLALLEGFAHEKLTAPETGDLLERCGKPDDETARDFIRIFARDHARAVSLPADFVREAARAEGLSQAAWAEARKNNDFAAFVPHLQKMTALARARAGYWRRDAAQSDYDVLLDSYEPGMNEAETGAVFAPLGKRLGALLKKISAAPQIETGFLHQKFEIQNQEAFNRELLRGLGFDTKRGRLDVSAHPFTTTLGFNDVRITTRYAEHDIMSGIFSVIHEAGHAFYELAQDSRLRGLCLAEGSSMGIHESQSRLWENVIGKSRAFWEGWLPVLKARFPRELDGVELSGFYRAVNAAGPSFIRTEADEVSYSLHIILRFELERRLAAGTLDAAGAPGAWNAAMKNLFGIEPPDDARGILQDVHWSMGAFGYFPSYALGNLYSLHFWRKLRTDIPGVDRLLARREYAEIHEWLKNTVHGFGRRLDPAELLLKATGEKLSSIPFLDYTEEKYSELYGL